MRRTPPLTRGEAIFDPIGLSEERKEFISSQPWVKPDVSVLGLECRTWFAMGYEHVPMPHNPHIQIISIQISEFERLSLRMCILYLDNRIKIAMKNVGLPFEVSPTWTKSTQTAAQGSKL